MNKILEDTKSAILAKVDQRLLPAVQKAVQGGEDIMYSDQMRHQLLEVVKHGDDPEAVGSAVAKLLAVLVHMSQNTMPPEIGGPASVMLLCEALQFMEDAGRIQVTPEMLAECTKALGSAILQLYGVGPEKLQSLMNKAQSASAAGPASQPSGIVNGATAGGV